MTVTQFDIGQIISEASFLYERLSKESFNIDTARMNGQEADTRLAHWCQVIAQGNWEKFYKWLEWNGWNMEQVRLALGTVPLVEDQTLPSWAKTVKEIIQAVSEQNVSASANGTMAQQWLDPENPQPFEDVLLPVMPVARQKLLAHLGLVSLSSENFLVELLSEPAYLSLERTLLHKLLSLCAKTLMFEFSHFRPLGYNLLYQVIKEVTGTPKKDYYDAFVQKLLSDGLLAFFQKYPVLARLVAVAIEFWVEATAEFLQRLKTDVVEIQSQFNPSRQPEHNRGGSTTLLGKVIEIQCSLSDPHNQGHEVFVLTFESGLKLVYKPKNLALEVTYSQFLDWCNRQGAPLPFKVLQVINRGTYGWVEYVEQLPCADEAAAQRFYQRAGMLLCLVYVLLGADCHYENLIASGEHLVLIDMETLLHHDAKPMDSWNEETAAQALAAQQFDDSVLYTGLLPCWGFSEDSNIAYDFSGLGSVDPQRAPKRVPVWKYINTDDMHQGSEEMTLPLQANVAVLNGMALSPNHYLEELVTGFTQMYRFLIEKRQVLLAENSALAAFQGQLVRFIFRPTKVYDAILQKIVAPQYLRNGADWSIELDVLGRAFLSASEKSLALPIYRAEVRAMQQLDIPYFGALSGSDALSVGVEKPIEKYFKAPSYSDLVSKLQALNEAELQQQVAIIKLAFYARVARPMATIVESSAVREHVTERQEESEGKGDSVVELLSPEALIQEARAIATEIQERAIKGVDGSVTWIGLGYVPSIERFQLMPLGETLYEGNCGIALFLAALEYVTGSNQFRDTALGCLQSLQNVLRSPDFEVARSYVRDIGIGGATGLGSIIYSLVKIGRFLQLPVLIEDALRAANLMTPEMIGRDRKFDVMGGSAGAILGLLALYQETNDSKVLEKVITCGQHLLDHRSPVDSFKTWKTVGGKPLTGFSHGAAGIAYSLLRLYAATGNSTYLEAACEGIAYEGSVFSPSAANWPDFRFVTTQSEPPTFWSSWCHGASGIGLARLGGLSIHQTNSILADVEVALQTTQQYSLQEIDHLCCGNLGRCDVLLVAAQKLSRLQFFEMARKEASLVVYRAKQTGTYQLLGSSLNAVFSPSFFQGTSGIGYQLLRLAYPDSLPSVLLWD